MRLLTATSETQGGRNNDFAWTVEGELVWVGNACGSDANNPDGRCGCARSFTGLSSGRTTTTAQVRELGLTRMDLRLALGGYLENVTHYDTGKRWLIREVDELIRLGELWPEGTVIERRRNHLLPRLRLVGRSL
jgi:hypothetical protein